MKKYFLAVVFLCLSILSYSKDTEVVLDQDANTIEVTQAKDLSKLKGKSKKQTFIDTLIPVIEKIRDDVEKEREYVSSLIEKEVLSPEEFENLTEK